MFSRVRGTYPVLQKLILYLLQFLLLRTSYCHTSYSPNQYSYSYSCSFSCRQQNYIKLQDVNPPLIQPKLESGAFSTCHSSSSRDGTFLDFAWVRRVSAPVRLHSHRDKHRRCTKYGRNSHEACLNVVSIIRLAGTRELILAHAAAEAETKGPSLPKELARSTAGHGRWQDSVCIVGPDA